MMDAYDRFWQWAEKPLESPLTLPADLHQAVMELAPEDRRDRGKVNQAAALVDPPRLDIGHCGAARVRRCSAPVARQAGRSSPLACWRPRRSVHRVERAGS